MLGATNLRDFWSEGVSLPPAQEHFVIEGESYTLYDPRARFQDWRDRYIGFFIKSRSLNIFFSDALFQLMREIDLGVLESHLNVEEYTEACEYYFKGGFYNKVRSLRAWDSIKDRPLDLASGTTVSIPLGETTRRLAIEAAKGRLAELRGEGQASPILKGILETATPAKRVQITWEGMLNLCEAFQETEIIGNCPAMVDLYKKTAQTCERIKQYPGQPNNILIYGETGTGKELLSKAIHKLSGRSGELEAVNCAAISPELLESELFGHVKGAFTGATADKKGIFEFCNGGTVQLDEINRMDQRHLPKILRALQEREIRPVGGSGTIQIDVLFIATTNKDLTQRVNGGDFPRDLHDRLSGTTLKIPPLRERLSDVPLLVKHFLGRDYPNSHLDQLRFPFTLWCIDRAQHDPTFSIRGLQNAIKDCVARSLEPRLNESREMTRLRAAAEKVKGSWPITQAELARRAEVKPSTLHDEPWKSCVQKLMNEGLVRKTKNFVRKKG